MFCPQCGTETLEQLKFCKKCGVDLRRVQTAIGRSGADAPTNEWVTHWNHVALEEHREKLDRKKKKTPEEKRVEEIKAGVITSLVGLGLVIFLSIFFDAVAETVAGPESNILRAIPFVGLIPLLVGVGLIINGMVVSKRLVELKRNRLDQPVEPVRLPVADTSRGFGLPEPAQSPVSDFSVTEPTTTRLREPLPAPPSQAGNKQD